MVFKEIDFRFLSTRHWKNDDEKLGLILKALPEIREIARAEAYEYMTSTAPDSTIDLEGIRNDYIKFFLINIREYDAVEISKIVTCASTS
jgi:hypothetical protein